jgi:hypothetical protein
MKLWNLILANPVIVAIIAAVVGTIFASPKLSAAIKGMFGGLFGKTTPQQPTDTLRWEPTPQYPPTVVPGNLPSSDSTFDDDAPKSEAEHRVIMFSWLDEMRTYAINHGKTKAVASANQLLNDLFTEVDHHEPTNVQPANPST